MNLVIDAQIFAAYFQEDVLQLPVERTQRTGSTKPIFARLGTLDFCYLDVGELIENEWQRLVEPEWFNNWFREKLLDGSLVRVPVDRCQALKNKLRKLRFPNDDFIYVRTAKKVVDDLGACLLVSEDMHFYDPLKKKTKHKHRMKLFREQRGPVAKQLRKENIIVCCAANYLDQSEN